jgi:hypothetical protein
MILEQPFPFWTSDKVITYSELQKLCAEKYEREGPALIDRCKRNIERYSQMASRRDTLEVMLALDADSLELSAQNAIWTDFSVAVFEVFVLPSKPSITKTAQYLWDVFNSTLRRIANGDTAATIN